MEPEDQEQEIEMEQEPLKIYQEGGAVNSVNGQTGDVVLTTSDLENDSDYQTGSEVEGSISDAIGQLSIPTKTSELENDGEDGESVYVEADELDAVATSGDYNDLKNKPTIPAAQVNSDWNATTGVAEILNKPTIPTVNDATLTITQNGTSKGTFTANDADDTTIEVSDTTYSNFTGTDGVSAGASGLVPAPATTDAGKFLKADGTWDTAGGSSVTVVQTTGTSQSDVMSQDATSSLVYNDPGTDTKIAIGNNAYATMGNNAIEIGHYSKASSSQAIAIGGGNSSTAAAKANAIRAIAIGTSLNVAEQDAIGIGYNAGAGTPLGVGSVGLGNNTNTGGGKGCVSLGYGSQSGNVETAGIVSVGNLVPTDASYGYNSSTYRLITGVYDGQNAHDAVTVGQLNATIDAINTALSTNIPHVGA